MPLHVTTLSCQSSRNYHLPPDWDLSSPINILTLKNPYVQSVRSLSPRKGNSHFETSKLQVVDSAHIQENQPPLVEVTARVLFSKTTNINLASPTSTFSHLHSDDVHAVGGLSDFTTRGPFLESSNNFQARKAVLYSPCLHSRRVQIILKIIKWNYQLTKQNWPVFELRVGTGLSGSLSRRLL